MHLAPPHGAAHIPHDTATGDQPAKAFTVGKRVARPDGSSGPSSGERSWQTTFSLMSDPGISLNHLGFVCQGGVDVYFIEPPGNHWK